MIRATLYEIINICPDMAFSGAFQPGFVLVSLHIDNFIEGNSNLLLLVYVKTWMKFDLNVVPNGYEIKAFWKV